MENLNGLKSCISLDGKEVFGILLRKEIECILRAILYPESYIALLCKDDEEAQKCMNDFSELIDRYKIVQHEISEEDNGDCISFKNGSCIKTIEKREQDNNQPIRGKRFDKFMDNIQDFIIDEEAFESAIKPFLNNTSEVEVNNRMYIDVGLDKENGSDYKIRLYKEDKMESITSDNMKVIAEYIRNVAQANNYSVYIDSRGFGRYLADCLEEIGMSYIPLKHENLKFNISG